MAVSRLARLAAAAPAPVYAAVGAGAQAAVDGLRADSRLRFVHSPRHATVLLVAGAVPAPFIRPLARVHDQLSHPRTTVWWTGEGPVTIAGLPTLTCLSAGDDVVARLTDAHRDLVYGNRATEEDLLPDAPPNEWRGVGENGQGGDGMMGGVPYGRPMAMTADDRDGLALDPLSLTLGPFLQWLPPGLELHVTMQGDVLTRVELGADPWLQGTPLGAPVNIDEPLPHLQRARAKLRYVARVLDLHGLPALAHRTYALANTLTPESGARISRLRRRLDRTTALRWSTKDVGHLSSQMLGSPGHPWNGDAMVRWQRALEDARNLIDDPDQGPDQNADPSPDAADLAVLPALLTGMEFAEAVTTVVSLEVASGLPSRLTRAPR